MGHSRVAYDEELADRLREVLAGEREVSEKPMFGGLAFLVSGRLAVAASSQGGLLVRVDPARSDELCSRPHASRMVMGGREVDGWLRVGAEALRTMRQLESWVRLGVGYAGSLPPGGARRARGRSRRSR